MKLGDGKQGIKLAWPYQNCIELPIYLYCEVNTVRGQNNVWKLVNFFALYQNDHT